MSAGIRQIDAAVDWSVPWLDSIRDVSLDVVAAADWRLALNAASARMGLRTHSDQPLCFIPQSGLPPGRAYEEHIGLTGEVPTRENLHDFFNALVWLAFPETKTGLNALQAAQIARLGVGQSRGSVRDAATLFDENAALLAVEDSADGRRLVEALREHRWNQLFVLERTRLWACAEVFLFGHALMEKLVHPYKAITAHTLVCWVSPDFFHLPLVQRRATLDRQLSVMLKQELTQTALLPSSFSPLQVLGVPGWWPCQDAEFYADVAVFRPKRQQRQQP